MRVLVLAAGVAVVLTGCTGDAEREPEERRNLAALSTIRVPPGAVTVSTETFGEHAPDTSDGPIVGWATVRELRLARAVKAADVVAASDRALRRAGWQVDGGGDFYLNARRGQTCLHFLTLTDAPAPPDTPPPEVVAGEPDAAEPAPGDRVARGLSLKLRDC